MQKSSTRPNGWVLTDTENGIVVTFDDGNFNDTQKVTPLDDVNTRRTCAYHERVRRVGCTSPWQ